MFEILPESAGLETKIEALLDATFGPGRQGKTVYKLRDGVDPVSGLSFEARLDGAFVGSIRFWPIEIDGRWPAILLGPIAVDPAHQGKGIGKALIRHGLYAATRAGHKICVLVGDKPYYEKFGFVSAADAGLELPGPVALDRFQVMALAPGALDGVSGPVGRPSQGRSTARGRRSRAA